jgi:dihydrofolate synthase / folylpolyglutamate synthase
MNYDESLAYIDALAPTILNPDLTRFAAFMKLHGSPQDGIPCFHVAGTNGKGSTVAIIDSALLSAGYKVGRYTGPHLLRWNERFHINGKPITDRKFAELTTRLRKLSEEFGDNNPELGPLTWFELLTAIAFFWFAESGVDFAVYEVGLGGRWDATNVIAKPLVSVITTIDYDHTHILGDTLAKIAAEKAGIIKQGVPVVTATTGDAWETIKGKSTECGAPLFRCLAPDTVSGPTEINLEDVRRALPNVALVGHYQQLNAFIAGVALKVGEEECKLPLTAKLSDGFKKVYWPGRFQWLPDRNLILDGAHNVGGARALRESLDERFPHQRRVYVLGALEELLRPGDVVIASKAKSTRAVCAPELIAEKAREIGARAEIAESIAEAFSRALKTKSGDDIVIASGSFATVKETMHAMGWRTVEDGLVHARR